MHAPLALALLLLPLAADPPTTAAPGPPASPQAARPAPPSFGPAWDLLVGTWAGEGGGTPGAGSGEARFAFDLEGKVLIRRSRSDYPAADGKPAVRHEDLMVISPGASPDEAAAVYFDNEGHVIRYAAAWSADGKTLMFTTPKEAPGPRFRLVYGVKGDTLTVAFETAPPGGTEFRTHVSGVTRRAR